MGLFDGLTSEQKEQALKRMQKVFDEMTPEEKEKDRVHNEEYNKGKTMEEYKSFSSEFQDAVERIRSRNSPEVKAHQAKVEKLEREQDLRDLRILSLMPKEERLAEYLHRADYSKDDSDEDRPHTDAYAKATRYFSTMDKKFDKPNLTDEEAELVVKEGRLLAEIRMEKDKFRDVSLAVFGGEPIEKQQSNFIKKPLTSIKPTALESVKIVEGEDPLTKKDDVSNEVTRTHSYNSIDKRTASTASISSDDSSKKSVEQGETKKIRFPVYHYMRTQKPVQTAVGHVIHGVQNRIGGGGRSQ